MFITILCVVVSLVIATPSPLSASVSRSETVIRSSAYSGGNTVVQNGVSTGFGTSSARATIIINGETVVDEYKTSNDGPVSIDVRYPTTNTTVITATTSSPQRMKETRLSPREESAKIPEIGFEAFIPTEPIPPSAPSEVEPITNVVNEDTVRELAPEKPVTHTATPETFWTRMALSFARTITYVTSFLFK